MLEAGESHAHVTFLDVFKGRFVESEHLADKAKVIAATKASLEVFKKQFKAQEEAYDAIDMEELKRLAAIIKAQPKATQQSFFFTLQYNLQKMMREAGYVDYMGKCQKVAPFKFIERALQQTTDPKLIGKSLADLIKWGFVKKPAVVPAPLSQAEDEEDEEDEEDAGDGEDEGDEGEGDDEDEGDEGEGEGQDGDQGQWGNEDEEEDAPPPPTKAAPSAKAPVVAASAQKPKAASAQTPKAAPVAAAAPVVSGAKRSAQGAPQGASQSGKGGKAARIA